MKSCNTHGDFNAKGKCPLCKAQAAADRKRKAAEKRDAARGQVLRESLEKLEGKVDW